MLNRPSAFVVAILAVWGLASHPVAQQSSSERPVVRVQAPSTASGRVRVIVGLRGAFAPEGDLATSAAASDQRAAIRQGQAGVLSQLAGLGVGNVHAFETIPFLAMEVDASALAALSSLPNVHSVVQDEARKPLLFESTRLVNTWSASVRGFTGAGWSVAVLDTGTDPTHFMLSGKIVEEACYSVLAQCRGSFAATGSGASAPCAQTGCGHGTQVAVIAVGRQPEGFHSTISGTAKDATLVSVRVFSDTAQGPRAFDSDIIKGLERVLALRQGGRQIASVNLSLGDGLHTGPCDGEYPGMKWAIDNLRSVGVATVVASGNDYASGHLNAPACISSAISVGSTTKSDAISAFSNSASTLNLLAPGSEIYVPSYTDYNPNLQPVSGTSMAAPHVAGAWAILRQAKTDASLEDLYRALHYGGVPVTDPRNGLTRPRIEVDRSLSVLFPRAAKLTSPGSGTLLPGSTVTFEWDAGEVVAEYHLYVGSVPGGHDVYDGSQGTRRSITIGGLPTDGRKLYVRLWSRIGGYLYFRDESYTTKTLRTAPAEILSPVPGALAGGSANFTWTEGNGVTDYYLYVGTYPGGYDLYHGSQGLNRAVTVTTLPLDGRAVYVQLWSKIGGYYQIRSYQYWSPDWRAAITSPLAGSTLVNRPTFFRNTGTSVTDYYLYVGSSPGAYDIVHGPWDTVVQNNILAGLPVDGRPIHVRLWSKISGRQYFRDYEYRAATLTPVAAEMVLPTPGSQFGGSSGSIYFAWQPGVGVSEYYLYLGSSAWGHDLYQGSQGTRTDRFVDKLPSDGRTIHATLWSRIAGAWQVRQYTYTARDARAQMWSPTAGSTLPGAVAEFWWYTTTATEYHLYVGSTPGGWDIYDRSHFTAQFATISGLPTDGRTLYVRLWSRIEGILHFRDYVYKAATK